MENKENNSTSNISAQEYNRLLELEIKTKQAHIQELKDTIRTEQDNIQKTKQNQSQLLLDFQKEQSTLQGKIANTSQTMAMYKSKLLSVAFCLRRKLSTLETIKSKPSISKALKAKVQETIDSINSHLKKLQDSCNAPEMENIEHKLYLQHQKIAELQS